MTSQQQTVIFQLELGKLIDRFADEFDLDYQSIIGCLEIQKHELLTELFEEDE